MRLHDAVNTLSHLLNATFERLQSCREQHLTQLQLIRLCLPYGSCSPAGLFARLHLQARFQHVCAAGSQPEQPQVQVAVLQDPSNAGNSACYVVGVSPNGGGAALNQVRLTAMLQHRARHMELHVNTVYCRWSYVWDLCHAAYKCRQCASDTAQLGCCR